MKRLIKYASLTLALTGFAIWLGFALRPKPVDVEVRAAVRGPLEVTIDEDGQTQAHDRFTLAAPVPGRLSRITHHEGDEAGPGVPIATILPLPVDAREAEEIRARFDAAEAREREAREAVAKWSNENAQAKRELDRVRNLARDRLIAQQELETAESKYTTSVSELEGARHRARAAAADVARERAGLASIDARAAGGGASSQPVVLRAPVPRCRILRIHEKSERVVPAGTPIVTLSNPGKLEIVVDVLSTDAVRIRPGNAVRLENWGDPQPLRARVRTVEPYAFTKVSVLGVEEQRVNVIADFIDSPASLGDGYRVDARIVIWESADVLKIPASALFRAERDQWMVFVAANGRASRRAVQPGHRNASEAEIVEGLQPGEVVVLHPPNDLDDGDRIAVRNGSR